MEQLSVRKTLLAKESWDYKDIQLYFNVGQTKANSIKNRAIKEFNGAVPYSSSHVKTDSVLRLFGSTRENEIHCIKEITNEKESI